MSLRTNHATHSKTFEVTLFTDNGIPVHTQTVLAYDMAQARGKAAVLLNTKAEADYYQVKEVK
jgi:hypothetical protein